MALIKCPECGKEISDSVKTCPNCGFRIKKRKKNFFLKHKVLSLLLAIICLSGIGIAIFVNTHNFLTYEENAVLNAINHVKKNTIYKDSIHIKNVEIAYITPEEMDAIHDPHLLSYISDLTGDWIGDFTTVNSKRFINVLIEYEMVGQDNQIVEAHMICSLDNDGKILSSFGSTNAEGDISGYDAMAVLQWYMQEYRSIDQDIFEKLEQISESRKKKIIKGEFPEINTEKIDKFIFDYINYLYKIKLDMSYYKHELTYKTDGKITEPKEIESIKHCIENLKDKELKKQTIQMVNVFFIESIQDMYDEAMEYEKDDWHSWSTDIINDSLQVFKFIIKTDTDKEKVSQLKEKCEKLSSQIQEKITAEELESKYNAVITQLENNKFEEAQEFFEKNKDYKDSQKFLNQLKTTEKWLGVWRADIPYINGIILDAKVTIKREYQEDTGIALGVYYEIENKPVLQNQNYYLYKSEPRFLQCVTGGFGGGGFQGGAASGSSSSGNNSVEKQEPEKPSVEEYNVHDGYWYNVDKNNTIKPIYSYADYTSYNYAENHERNLLKDLIQSIQLNDDGTITILNEYKWVLTKQS